MPGRWKSNLLLGLAGGLAGTAAMNLYWAGLSRIKPDAAGSGDEEATTVKVARRALRRAGVNSPSRQTRVLGGQVVHWGYGAGWGLAAGVARAAGLSLDWGYGLPLGVGLWAFGDLWMLHQLDLAKHPREYPTEAHASALGAHLAYGLGAWAAMEGLGKLQQPKSKFLRHAA